MHNKNKKLKRMAKDKWQQPCVELVWKGSEHSQDLAINMFNLMSKKELVDITLKADDGQELEAHKIVLSSASCYFQKLFAASPSLTCTSLDMPFTVLEALVQYCYVGKLKIPVYQVTLCIEAANWLGIRGFGKLSSQEQGESSSVPKNNKDDERNALASHSGQPQPNANDRMERPSIPECIQEIVLPNGLSVEKVRQPFIKLHRIDHVLRESGAPAQTSKRRSSSLPSAAKPLFRTKRPRVKLEQVESRTGLLETQTNSPHNISDATCEDNIIMPCITRVETLVQNSSISVSNMTPPPSRALRSNSKGLNGILSVAEATCFYGWSEFESYDEAKCFLRPSLKLTCHACKQPFGFNTTFKEHLSWCHSKHTVCPRCGKEFSKVQGMTSLMGHLNRCIAPNSQSIVQFESEQVLAEQEHRKSNRSSKTNVSSCKSKRRTCQRSTNRHPGLKWHMTRRHKRKNASPRWKNINGRWVIAESQADKRKALEDNQTEDDQVSEFSDREDTPFRGFETDSSPGSVCSNASPQSECHRSPSERQ